MKFKGFEIEIPTLLQVEIYVAEKGYYFSPKEFYDIYSKRGWLTLKGKPIKSLEATIDSFNSTKMIERLPPEERNRRSKKQRRIDKLRKINEEKIYGEIKKKRVIEHKDIKYSEQLKDKRWKIFRSAALAYYHNRCVCCGSKENLQVHHMKYRKGRYAWEYNFDDVVVLCRDCHRKEHDLE